PVAQASVSLARRRYVDGERRLVGQSGSSTDDRGEFRAFGVAPGDYVVIASCQGFDFGSRDRVRYVPTYYPGTPLANDAQHVTVSPGQEVTGIVIALVKASTATVRGSVRSSGETPVGPLTVVVASQIGGAQAEGQHAMATASSDGSFAIAGLLPGAYLFEARSMRGSEVASKEVVVEGSDVGGVNLVLSRGATAHGRITFDTGKPPDGLRPSEIFVGAIALDHHMGAMVTGGGPPTAHDDWSFELRGL